MGDEGKKVEGHRAILLGSDMTERDLGRLSGWYDAGYRIKETVRIGGPYSLVLAILEKPVAVGE